MVTHPTKNFIIVIIFNGPQGSVVCFVINNYDIYIYLSVTIFLFILFRYLLLFLTNNKSKCIGTIHGEYLLAQT